VTTLKRNPSHHARLAAWAARIAKPFTPTEAVKALRLPGPATVRHAATFGHIVRIGKGHYAAPGPGRKARTTVTSWPERKQRRGGWNGRSGELRPGGPAASILSWARSARRPVLVADAAGRFDIDPRLAAKAMQRLVARGVLDRLGKGVYEAVRG